MKINIDWRKTLLILADLAIAVYLVFAFTSWNKPAEASAICTKVDINIEDENENGFMKTAEVKSLLEKHHLYPLSKRIDEINTREIENQLSRTAFVKTAECYVTREGHVHISITQRTPIIRVKADNGDDYYIDDNGGIMPNSQYTSDMIIVTGHVSKAYACSYISVVAECIMEDELWHNQIEQLNVLPDKTIEIVPRVGDHIVNIGMLPNHKDAEKRYELVSEFVKKQFHRLELFYKYGLSEAGWNKYSYISLEYSNQVICSRREAEEKKTPLSIEKAPEDHGEQMTDVAEPVQKKDEKNEQQDSKKENKSQQSDSKKETKKDSKPDKSDNKKDSKKDNKSKDVNKKDKKH